MSSAKVQIPSRFEGLLNAAQGDELSTIVRPVRSALAVLDEIYDDMQSAGRGAFLVLYGCRGRAGRPFCTR